MNPDTQRRPIPVTSATLHALLPFAGPDGCIALRTIGARIWRVIGYSEIMADVRAGRPGPLGSPWGWTIMECLKQLQEDLTPLLADCQYYQEHARAEVVASMLVWLSEEMDREGQAPPQRFHN